MRLDADELFDVPLIGRLQLQGRSLDQSRLLDVQTQEYTALAPKNKAHGVCEDALFIES